MFFSASERRGPELLLPPPSAAASPPPEKALSFPGGGVPGTSGIETDSVSWDFPASEISEAFDASEASGAFFLFAVSATSEVSEVSEVFISSPSFLSVIFPHPFSAVICPSSIKKGDNLLLYPYSFKNSNHSVVFPCVFVVGMEEAQRRVRKALSEKRKEKEMEKGNGKALQNEIN